MTTSETDWGVRLQRVPLHASGAQEADRPTTRKVYADDHDEHPQVIDLPGPRLLATRWLAPTLRDAGLRLRRSKGTLLLQRGDGTPTAVATDELARVLLARLRALPAPTPTDSETYGALWTLGARVREPEALGYLHGVAMQAKRAASRWEPPKTTREPLPAAELRRRSRANVKEREAMTARAWLDVYVSDEDAPPPSITTTGLLEAFTGSPLVAEWLEVAEEAPEEWLDGEHEEYGGPACLPRVGGSRGFYAVATDVLGDKFRAPGGRSWLFSTVEARRAALGDDAETLADLFLEEHDPREELRDEARRRAA